MEEETALPTKQTKAIPILLAAKSYEKGCKSTRISNTTFYKWMKDEGFAAEFDRQRNKIAEAALGMIAQNIEKAVSVLVGLLDNYDPRVQSPTVNDII